MFRNYAALHLPNMENNAVTTTTTATWSGTKSAQRARGPAHSPPTSAPRLLHTTANEHSNSTPPSTARHDSHAASHSNQPATITLRESSRLPPPSRLHRSG